MLQDAASIPHTTAISCLCDRFAKWGIDMHYGRARQDILTFPFDISAWCIAFVVVLPRGPYFTSNDWYLWNYLVCLSLAWRESTYPVPSHTEFSVYDIDSHWLSWRRGTQDDKILSRLLPKWPYRCANYSNFTPLREAHPYRGRRPGFNVRFALFHVSVTWSPLYSSICSSRRHILRSLFRLPLFSDVRRVSFTQLASSASSVIQHVHDSAEETKKERLSLNLLRK